MPLIYKVIKKNLSKKKYKIFELKNLKISKIVTLNVNKINQVGSDRIANAIGAYEYYKNNCLVIDFGTATTFDIISKKGIYEGGIIAPGTSSAMNLNKFTTFSGKIPEKSYGKNTKEALNAGFIWGYQG